MNNTLRSVMKFLLVGLFLLVLSGFAFCAGFGSAYMLTEDGDALPLPIGARPGPTVTPAPPTEEQDEAEAPLEAEEGTPTPTLVPIPTPANETQESFQVFWEVWDLVQRNFYGELPSMQQVTYAAIRGMLNTLDDEYTAFLEPSVASILAEDATGEFEGIGAYVGLDDEGYLEITEPFEDGPAERAGLRAGDRVLAVDGTSIVGATLYEGINLIRGPAETDVTLLIEREGEPEPFEVTVTRQRLQITIVDVEMRDDGIGYIRLREFSAKASEHMEDGLEELLAQDPRGIVFDLRQNPGGWLEQAVEVSDLFLDDGTIVSERWSDGREYSFDADAGDVGEDVPLVVLVDRNSASASEIVAGALQDRERAVLIGELTFGKGSVQQVFQLSDGSELRVTAARWFTPNDRAIHGQGITPDIEIPWPEPSEEGEDVDVEQDPQLDRAVEYFLSGE
jgi:carboxyl-terminal processing protease